MILNKMEGIIFGWWLARNGKNDGVRAEAVARVVLHDQNGSFFGLAEILNKRQVRYNHVTGLN